MRMADGSPGTAASRQPARHPPAQSASTRLVPCRNSPERRTTLRRWRTRMVPRSQRGSAVPRQHRPEPQAAASRRSHYRRADLLHCQEPGQQRHQPRVVPVQPVRPVRPGNHRPLTLHQRRLRGSRADASQGPRHVGPLRLIAPVGAGTEQTAAGGKGAGPRQSQAFNDQVDISV
jgi:hypothetical protein